MKVYITKYALTQGILEKEVEPADRFPNMVVDKSSGGCHAYYHTPFWYTNEDEAIAHAKVLQKKKLDSLTNTIVRIAKLTFPKQS